MSEFLFPEAIVDSVRIAIWTSGSQFSLVIPVVATGDDDPANGCRVSGGTYVVIVI